MKWDELKSTFQASTPDVSTTGEEVGERQEQLLSKVKHDAQRFERRIRRRDMIESVTAIALFVVFGMMLPNAGWLARSGLLIIMASCVFTIWRLYRARNDREDLASDSVAEHLQRDIRRVDTQVRLLRNVLWWYLLPPGIGLALLTFGIDGLTLPAFIYIGFVVLLYAWVHHINQQAVRRELLPRREALQQQLDELVANGDTDPE
ncbi:MAG: hypothetical protein R3270_10665 [Gammaproteobacteria bacterium]|nr:hypothetical protein [Gammaproteobacteria bacterium]